METPLQKSCGSTSPLEKNLSSEEKPVSSSSFSKESVTTKIPPIVRFGPFGSGGTVVGFSKYNGVRAAFEENFARRLELGAQLVIYEKGEKVVDLYGFAPEEPDYDGETLQFVASSGKNMESIAMAMLVDRGLVYYDDLVQKHWPEFGASGKEQITISDVMRHAGGVPFVVDSDSKKITPITTEDILAVDPMEQKICMAEKHPNSKNAAAIPCYHALTRGFIVNGIFRRVDGRSLGRFFREEITEPLSSENETTVKFFCGIPKKEQPEHKFANFTQGSIFYTVFVQILPALLGFNKQLAAFPFGCFFRSDGLGAFVKSVAFPTLLFEDYINSPFGRSIEISSSGMFANARSMAVINAATMAGDGSIRGVRLLSPEGVAKSMDSIVTRTDSALDTTLGFTQGGYCSFQESFVEGAKNEIFHPDDKTAYGNFIGWGGFGGSLSLVDREKKISFAYCMNGIGIDALWGVRTRRILLELQKEMSSE